jgi:folate-binding protein YgfZ
MFFAMQPDLVADLSHNALLGVAGDDAATFLQGQFTNDVQSLAVGEAQWNGWCSAKGRLIATFLLLRRADGFVLMLPAEIAATVAKRLGMFVLRSKVKIQDVSALEARVGIAGPDAAALVAGRWGAVPEPMRSVDRDGATCIALGGDRFVALVPIAAAAALREIFSAGWERGGADAWEWTSIQAGVPTIVAATQEAFVPQMANFELVGGVSFKKGCYPGQEIVARTQYRGGLKRRMALAHVAGAERPLPGQSVYSSAFAGQSAGTIVNAAPSPEGGFDALVIAQVEALAQRDLRWNSPDGPPVEIRRHPPLATAS